MEVIFKNFAPFTDRISEINNSQIDNAKYLDILMAMHNLIQYSDSYSKTSGKGEQFCRYKQNDHLRDSKLFKFKVKIRVKNSNDSLKNY